MGRLTDQPFVESCCDGGLCETGKNCGCDTAAGHQCENCRMGAWVDVEQQLADMKRARRFPGEPETSPEVQELILGPGVAQVLQPRPSGTDRKNYPVTTGVFDYFPDALLEVAAVSKAGSKQHHPDEPLHWDRSKSTDDADALGRHLLQRGTRDDDGQRHSAKVAWRALAVLQKEIEAEREKRHKA
jgi:hypothetical protein